MSSPAAAASGHDPSAMSGATSAGPSTAPSAQLPDAADEDHSAPSVVTVITAPPAVIPPHGGGVECDMHLLHGGVVSSREMFDFDRLSWWYSAPMDPLQTHVRPCTAVSEVHGVSSWLISTSHISCCVRCSASM